MSETAVEKLGLALRAARQELAELQEALTGAYSLGAVWRDGQLLPDSVHLTGEDDGDGPDIEIDASCVLREVQRRQAKTWCDSVAEGPSLEQLLALVPPEYELEIVRGIDSGYLAMLQRSSAPDVEHEASGPTREAAIRAATLLLLAKEHQCRSCEHWDRDGKPAHYGDGSARWCRVEGEQLRHPAGGQGCDQYRVIGS